LVNPVAERKQKVKTKSCMFYIRPYIFASKVHTQINKYVHIYKLRDTPTDIVLA
jgi:hypothetical protein